MSTGLTNARPKDLPKSIRRFALLISLLIVMDDGAIGLELEFPSFAEEPKSTETSSTRTVLPTAAEITVLPDSTSVSPSIPKALEELGPIKASTSLVTIFAMTISSRKSFPASATPSLASIVMSGAVMLPSIMVFTSFCASTRETPPSRLNELMTLSLSVISLGTNLLASIFLALILAMLVSLLPSLPFLRFEMEI